MFYRLQVLKEKFKLAVVDNFLVNGFYFKSNGTCLCCDQEVAFVATNSWLRDSFQCPVCHSIPRERALMLAVQNLYPDWKNLAIHESSPSNRGTSKKIKENCKNYTATQYFPNTTFGQVVNGFRNEDLEKQTFGNEIFDIVITQDVMEHIYNPAKAFQEIARTLKPGGAYIFTAPIINKFKKSEVWATLGENGEPIFLKTPEYHGNPVDAKGSPVTMHWGYDIVDFIKENSGLQTHIEYYDELKYGIRAEYIEVIVCKKV